MRITIVTALSCLMTLALVAYAGESAREQAFALNEKGVAHYEVQEYDLAVNAYNRTIELDATLAQTHNNKGMVYKDLGDHDRALADFNRAI